MNQLSINFKAPPRVRGSATSKAAAERAAPRAGTKRAQVLDYIRSCSAQGATDDEMQSCVPMSPNTQRPRRVELVRGGFIKDSGRTRPTSGGDQAVVWVLA